MKKILKMIIGQAGGRYGLLLAIGILLEAVLFRVFAEKTGWAYFLLGSVGLLPIVLFVHNRAVVHLWGLVCILLLMAGVFWLDTSQETDREQVLHRTHELLSSVERADFGVMDRYVADNFTWQGMNKRALLERARRVLDPRQSRGCSITSAQVEGNQGDPILVVAGNLTATGQFGQEIATFVGLIELRFQRQPDGKYRVVGTRVNYPGGQEVVLPSR